MNYLVNNCNLRFCL